MKKNVFFIVVVALATSLGFSALGCGRYTKPLPPENFAPAAVQSLSVSGQVDGVKLSWKAPQNDARGKNLKQINGYRIYRKSLATIADIARLKGEDQLVTSITDTHLEDLEKMKNTLREQGQNARRVSLPTERYNFDFLDTQVIPSGRYAYRVVPVNQGGVEGVSDQVVQVSFLGERSEIVIVKVVE